MTTNDYPSAPHFTRSQHLTVSRYQEQHPELNIQLRRSAKVGEYLEMPFPEAPAGMNWQGNPTWIIVPGEGREVQSNVSKEHWKVFPTLADALTSWLDAGPLFHTLAQPNDEPDETDTPNARGSR